MKEGEGGLLVSVVVPVDTVGSWKMVVGWSLGLLPSGLPLGV